MLIIMSIIIGILVIMEVIPIKFASRPNEFINNSEYTANLYICEHTAVTGGEWFADKDLNPWLSEDIDFILESNEVFGNISKIFTTEYEEPSGNLFVYWGTMKKNRSQKTLQKTFLI